MSFGHFHASSSTQDLFPPPSNNVPLTRKTLKFMVPFVIDKTESVEVMMTGTGCEIKAIVISDRRAEGTL